MLNDTDIGAQFRHKKTGSLYLLVGFAKLEKDESQQVIYRTWYGAGRPTHWVRPIGEFDQKFERTQEEGYRITERVLKHSEP